MSLKVSFVIPAYNEQAGLRATLESIPVTKLEESGFAVEIVVVDNNSTDDTYVIAKDFGALAVKETKQGYGYAYKRGFKESSGEIIITGDADGTYPFERSLWLLSELLEKNLSFITTNRFPQSFLTLDSMPFINRVGNMFLSASFYLLFGMTVKDSQSGMWVFKREVWEKALIHSNQMGFSQEFKVDALYYQKVPWAEYPIAYFKRLGTKKLRILVDGVGNLINLVVKRLRR